MFRPNSINLTGICSSSPDRVQVKDGVVAGSDEKDGVVDFAVVFCRRFFAGAGEQTVGLITDGTLYPVMLVMLGFAIAAMVAALVAAATRPKDRCAARPLRNRYCATFIR